MRKRANVLHELEQKMNELAHEVQAIKQWSHEVKQKLITAKTINKKLNFKKINMRK